MLKSFPKGTEDWIKNNKDRFPDLVRNINCFYINSLKVGDVQKEVHNLLLLKDIIFVSKLRTVNTGDLEISAYDYFRAFLIIMLRKNLIMMIWHICSLKRLYLSLAEGD